MNYAKYKLAAKRALKKGFRFEQIIEKDQFTVKDELWRFHGIDFYVSKDHVYIKSMASIDILKILQDVGYE